MKPPIKVAIVIVNYKTPGLVIECLKSLSGVNDHNLAINVFVGDADSQDGSVETISAFIRDNSLDWAQCFSVGKNGGFAYGNNTILQLHVLPD